MKGGWDSPKHDLFMNACIYIVIVSMYIYIYIHMVLLMLIATAVAHSPCYYFIIYVHPRHRLSFSLRVPAPLATPC